MVTIDLTAPALQLRPLRRTDVPRAIELHRRSLPSAFFDRLGPAFLRAYHRNFIASPYGVALEAVAGDRVLGFLVGTTDNAAHHRWVLRHRGPLLAALGLLGLLRDPRLIGVFARTRARRYAGAILRRFAPPPAPAGGGGSGPVAVLTHVVVSAAARRQGVGQVLVRRFIERTAGARYVALVTLVTLDGPEGAAPFYDRLGWRRHARRFDHDGRPILEYRLEPARG